MLRVGARTRLRRPLHDMRVASTMRAGPACLRRAASLHTIRCHGSLARAAAALLHAPHHCGAKSTSGGSNSTQSPSLVHRPSLIVAGAPGPSRATRRIWASAAAGSSTAAIAGECWCCLSHLQSDPPPVLAGGGSRRCRAAPATVTPAGDRHPHLPPSRSTGVARRPAAGAGAAAARSARRGPRGRRHEVRRVLGGGQAHAHAAPRRRVRRRQPPHRDGRGAVQARGRRSAGRRRQRAGRGGGQDAHQQRLPLQGTPWEAERAGGRPAAHPLAVRGRMPRSSTERRRPTR